MFLLYGARSACLKPVESHCSFSFEVQTWGSLSPLASHETLQSLSPDCGHLMFWWKQCDTMHSIFDLLLQQEQEWHRGRGSNITFVQRPIPESQNWTANLQLPVLQRMLITFHDISWPFLERPAMLRKPNPNSNCEGPLKLTSMKLLHGKSRTFPIAVHEWLFTFSHFDVPINPHHPIVECNEEMRELGWISALRLKVVWGSKRMEEESYKAYWVKGKPPKCPKILHSWFPCFRPNPVSSAFSGHFVFVKRFVPWVSKRQRERLLDELCVCLGSSMRPR